MPEFIKGIIKGHLKEMEGIEIKFWTNVKLGKPKEYAPIPVGEAQIEQNGLMDLWEVRSREVLWIKANWAKYMKRIPVPGRRPPAPGIPVGFDTVKFMADMNAARAKVIADIAVGDLVPRAPLEPDTLPPLPKQKPIDIGKPRI